MIIDLITVQEAVIAIKIKIQVRMLLKILTMQLAVVNQLVMQALAKALEVATSEVVMLALAQETQVVEWAKA